MAPSDGEESAGDAGRSAREDERWLVIDGRRWRRTDPSLPADVVAALQSHLGRARAAVRAARTSGDDDALGAARARVSLAKHGLGERGPYWWDEDAPARLARAREAIDALERDVPTPSD